MQGHMRRFGFANWNSSHHEIIGCWHPNPMISHRLMLPPRRSLAFRGRLPHIHQGHSPVRAYVAFGLSSRPLNGKQGEPLKLLISRKNAIHASFFSQWGTSLQDLERTLESPATTAYGAFLIDTGLQGRSHLLRFLDSETQILSR